MVRWTSASGSALPPPDTAGGHIERPGTPPPPARGLASSEAAVTRETGGQGAQYTCQPGQIYDPPGRNTNPYFCSG